MKRTIVIHIGDFVLLVSAAILALLLGGCIGLSHGSLRDENRVNLNRLELGMTKQQVITVMGEKTATAIDGKVSNPYRRELLTTANGTGCEVLYYYTEYYIAGASVDSTLTPVVLLEGKVAGIGWDVLDILGIKRTTVLKSR